jgi:cell wall-associated NlpC family hydrolase
MAQYQFSAGPHLPAGAALEPGDLVFFGASSSSVGHVGIYVGARGGQAMMVHAPHSGADVRVEAFHHVRRPLGQRPLPGRHPARR